MEKQQVELSYGLVDDVWDGTPLTGCGHSRPYCQSNKFHTTHYLDDGGLQVVQDFFLNASHTSSFCAVQGFHRLHLVQRSWNS